MASTDVSDRKQGNGKDGKGEQARQDALSRQELRRHLAQLSPKARFDALLDAKDARRLVRTVPAEDLYFSIAEVGLADATEIVQLASPAQFRAFVDLGGWTKDRIDPHQVLTWLRAARGDETEDFLAKVHGMDLEVLEHLLRSFTIIHDKEENPDVAVSGVTLETAEGRYLIEITVEGPEMSAVRQLLNDLIAENPFEATRLLEAIRWELTTELEETAYRFRSARLQDLGFPELYEALSLFAYLDPGAPPPGPPVEPGLAAAPQRVDYLEAAYGGLSDEEKEGLEIELRYVVNAALVAEAAEPGDLEAVRRVSEMARDYLSLALEHLSGGEPAKAADVVRERELKKIFQIGFSLTLKLKFRADRLAKAPLFRLGEVMLLLPEEEAGVAALRRKRPLRALKVEGAEPVPFRSRRELRDSEALLERAEAQVEIFSALLGGTPEAAQAAVARFGVGLDVLGVERLWTSIVALAALDPSLPPGPVPAGRVVELGERLFEKGPSGGAQLRPGVAERVRSALEPKVPEKARGELRRMVDRTLDRLLAELGNAYLSEGKLGATAGVILPVEGQPIL